MLGLRIIFGLVYYINLTVCFGYILFLIWTMFHNEMSYAIKRHPYFHNFPFGLIMKGLFILIFAILGFFGLIKLGLLIQNHLFPVVL